MNFLNTFNVNILYLMLKKEEGEVMDTIPLQIPTNKPDKVKINRKIIRRNNNIHK